MIRPLHLLLAVTACLSLSACAEKRNSDSAHHQADIEAKFHDYATQKGASAEWEKSLPGGNLYEAFTFQLQDALLGDKRPIAVRATLYDVSRNGETYHLLLRSQEDSFFLNLRANPEQVSTILKQGAAMFDEYAVIVQVAGVDRAEFKGKAETDPDVGARIEVDIPGTLVVTGDCLALEFLDGLTREKAH